MVATASTAPAPPSRCPVIDLVADTTTPSAAGPSAAAMAWPSTASPAGVEVACAFTCTTWSGSSPASASTAWMAATMPRPLGSGWAMWCASAE